MIFGYLIEHRLVFIACSYAITTLNCCLLLVSWRAYDRQTFVSRDEWLPPGVVGRAKSRKAQLALPLIGNTVFAIAALAFDDRILIEFFLGGFFILQLQSLALIVANLLFYRSLRNPDAAEGHIRYSPSVRYKSQAAYEIGAAILAVAGVVLTGCPAFAGAALFATATAVGAYRRARQATRGQLTVQ